MSGQGRRAPGRRPTIKDVAAEAGVSPAAVSKVFNGTGRISEPTRQRVQDSAARLGWSPNAAASALRRSRSHTIALVVRRPSDVLGTDPHFSELINGLESELAPRGYGLLLHLVADVDEEGGCTSGSPPRAGWTVRCSRRAVSTTRVRPNFGVWGCRSCCSAVRTE